MSSSDDAAGTLPAQPRGTTSAAADATSAAIPGTTTARTGIGAVSCTGTGAVATSAAMTSAAAATAVAAPGNAGAMGAGMCSAAASPTHPAGTTPVAAPPLIPGEGDEAVRRRIGEILREQAARGEPLTYKQMRLRVEADFGLPPDALKERRKEVNALVDATNTAGGAATASAAASIISKKSAADAAADKAATSVTALQQQQQPSPQPPQPPPPPQLAQQQRQRQQQQQRQQQRQQQQQRQRQPEPPHLYPAGDLPTVAELERDRGEKKDGGTEVALAREGTEQPRLPGGGKMSIELQRAMAETDAAAQAAASDAEAYFRLSAYLADLESENQGSQGSFSLARSGGKEEGAGEDQGSVFSRAIDGARGGWRSTPEGMR